MFRSIYMTLRNKFLTKLIGRHLTAEEKAMDLAALKHYGESLRYSHASSCTNCGGNMFGDGYTSVEVCEFAFDTGSLEPDAGPIYCTQLP